MIGSDWTYIGQRRWWVWSKRKEKGRRVLRHTLSGVVWRWTPIAGDSAKDCHIEIMRPLATELPLYGRAVNPSALSSALRVGESSKKRLPPISDFMQVASWQNAMIVLIMDSVMQPTSARDFAARLIAKTQAIGIAEETWSFTYALAATKYVESAHALKEARVLSP